MAGNNKSSPATHKQKQNQKDIPSKPPKSKEMPWQNELNDQRNELNEQRNEINALKEQILKLNTAVDYLKHDIFFINQNLELSHHVTEVLKIKLDEQMQYSRRYSVLVDNVPVNQNESTRDVEEEVKKILINDFKVDQQSLGNEFDKAHRLGQINKDNTQSIVVHFKNHSFRANLYSNRKTYQKGKMYYKLRIALTQRRRSLLAEAREKIQDVENADFAYASINGAIKIRAKIKVRNKQVFDVSSSEDIDKTIT